MAIAIRVNTVNSDVELYGDEQFIAGWKSFDTSQIPMQAIGMIRAAYEAGKAHQQQETAKTLRNIFGLNQ